jgi:acyl-CoA thioesterase
MAGARDLRSDTTLTRDPAVPGRFHGVIPDGWTVVHVFGGVTMYAALRAMQDALGRPELPLVTANAVFVAPVPAGPVTVDVEVLRDGRRASQVAADLRVPGTDGVALRVHGVFGAPHDVDHHHSEVRFPEVPPPAQVAPPPDDRPNPFGHINFHDQTEWRPVSPLDDPGRGQFLAWVRMLRGEPDLLTLAVHGDVLGPAVGRALGPSGQARMVLSLEIGIRFIAVPATPWVLQEIEAWHVGDGYATGPARLWDEERRLCAIATQTAHLRVMR